MVRSFRRSVRKHYGTSSSRLRHDHARRQSCNTAITSFSLGAETRVGGKSQDGCDVAEAGHGRGSECRAEGAALHGFDRGGGGNDCHLPTAHTAAAGQLSQCSSANDPAPDAFGVASLPATAGMQRRARIEADVEESDLARRRLEGHRGVVRHGDADVNARVPDLRLVRRTAMQTAVRMIATGVMLALLAGIAIKLKVFGNTP